jgi:aminoglycoside phosphotransferase (APT) family kinase protein
MTMTADSPGAFGQEAAIRAWTAATAGGEVTSWQRLGAGNSRTLWATDIAGRGGARSLVARVDTGDGPLSGTELTLEREAVVYQALAGHGLPVPRLVGADSRQRAMLLTRMPGTVGWSESVLDDLLAVLGRLHAIDASRLALPGLARDARDDVELWGRIAAARIRPPSPVLDLALPVLRARYPGEPERLVLCHGDAGFGNVLQREGRVTALLDWEFAHVGDPMDDLAWITVRAVLFGVELPDFARRVREHYEPAAGVAVDAGRLAYWQAVTLMRNLVCCLAATSNPVRGGDRLVHLTLIPALERQVVRALAGFEGVTLQPGPPLASPATSYGAELLREAVAELSQLLPALADAEAVNRGKRVRLLLRQLAESWALAPGAGAAVDAGVTGEPGIAARLRQLADDADRRLALLPRMATVGHASLVTISDELGTLFISQLFGRLVGTRRASLVPKPESRHEEIRERIKAGRAPASGQRAG